MTQETPGAACYGELACCPLASAVNGKPNEKTNPTKKQDRCRKQEHRVFLRWIVRLETVEGRRFRGRIAGLLVGLSSLIHCVRFERVKATLELDFVDRIELKRAGESGIEVKHTVEVLASVVFRLLHQVDFDQVVDDFAKIIRAIQPPAF